MERAAGSGGDGGSPGGGAMRYRDMEAIDLVAARKAVCAWLDEHQDGTLAQMAEDLKCRYPAHPDEMAVILRGMMRRRTASADPAGERFGWRSVPVNGDRVPLQAVRERAVSLGERRHEASPVPGRASGRSIQLAGDGPLRAVHRSRPARRDPGGVP